MVSDITSLSQATIRAQTGNLISSSIGQATKGATSILGALNEATGTQNSGMLGRDGPRDGPRPVNASALFGAGSGTLNFGMIAQLQQAQGTFEAAAAAGVELQGVGQQLAALGQGGAVQQQAQQQAQSGSQIDQEALQSRIDNLSNEELVELRRLAAEEGQEEALAQLGF